MKIRFGLVLSLALGVGAAGCAAGGASGGHMASPGVSGGVSGGQSLAVGERPRQDENTRTAQRLLEQADKMQDKAAAKPFYQQALDAAHAAIAADSTNPLPRLQAGEAAIGTGDFAEANKQLDKAEELHPLYQLQIQPIREKAWYSLYQEASPLVQAGKYDEAISVFEKANAIYRQRPEVMLVLGELYGQEQKNDRALANLDSAALIITDSTKLANVDSATAADWKDRLGALEVTKAQVLAQAGRYDEAVGAFQKLVQEHPDSLAYKRDLATLLVQTGKNDQAKPILNEMLQSPSLSASDYYQIGVGFYNMSDYTGAAKGFSGAASKSPKDRDALEMWTRCLSADSAYAKVPPVADRWIALDPNSKTAYILEAQAVNALGDGAKAQDLVNKIQAMKVTVGDMNIQRGRGGATVTGTMTNNTLAQGAQVTITFTFYDDSGNSVGTQSQAVTMPAKDQTQNFRVDFNSDARVSGYGYTVTTS